MGVPWAELFQAGNTIAGGHLRGRRARMVEDREYQQQERARQERLAEAAQRREDVNRQWSAAFGARQEQDKADRQRQRVQDEISRQLTQSLIEENKAQAGELNRRPLRGGGTGTAGGGRGNDRFSTTDYGRAAGLMSLEDVNRDLAERIEDNPADATLPGSAVFTRAAGGLARKVGAEDMGDWLEARGLNARQREFQGVAEQWAHQYVPNLPGFRMSVPMFRSVKRAFFPPPGERDPEVIRSFDTRRHEATLRLAQAHTRGATPPEISQMLVGILNGYGDPISAQQAWERLPGTGSQSQIDTLLERNTGDGNAAPSGPRPPRYAGRRR